MSEIEDDEYSAEASSAYPPSIQAGIPKLGETPSGWTRFRLGDLLKRVERPAKLIDSESYQLVTAKRNRGGIVAREVLRGKQIKTKTQFYVEARDFLISNRQISHGACGLVPSSLHGAVVSNEYTAFHTSKYLDPAFLNALSHSVYFQQTCFHSSIGVHVEKLVFRLEDWMGWEFDVPPLPEQQRIVAVVSAWDRAIEQTERLIAAKRQRLSALVTKLVFTRAQASKLKISKRVRLGDLAAIIRGVTYRPERDVVSGKSESAISILTAGNIQAGQVSVSGDELRVRISTAKNEQIARLGDFVLSMSNGSRNLVGKAGAVRIEPALLSAPGAFCAILRPHSEENRLLAALLFQSEGYREQLHIALAGSSINNLTNSELAEFEFALSPEITPALLQSNSCVVDDIMATEIYIANLYKQKRGLMQKLLAGEWRLGRNFE